MIRTERLDDVSLITIERPERRNALDIEHCNALATGVKTSANNGARSIVVAGVGTSFCAGADFAQVYEPAFRHSLYEMLQVIREVPVPVVAAVNGPAIGAGTQLAIACDLRVATNDALFSVPTAKIGIAVDPWTIRRLAALAGTSAANALVLGCAELRLDDALRFGLVNRPGDMQVACDWAKEIATFAPLTLGYSKAVLQQAEGREAEFDRAFEGCWASADAAEGRLARAEKRAPRFRGA